MSGNRSLDEFGAPDDAEESEPAAVEAVATDAPDQPASTEDVESPDSEATATDDEDDSPDPPASTYVWSPEGGPCADCGEPVEERWRDGRALVCGDCKEW